MFLSLELTQSNSVLAAENFLLLRLKYRLSWLYHVALSQGENRSMAGLWTLLESQPILTLFLVISVGYAAGEISIAGFRLGVGAVLFIGLLIGAFAPAAAPPAMLSTVGLILFFYGIGIHYGKAFVQGWRSPVRQRQNTIARISAIGAGLVTAAVMRAFNIPAEIGAGLFAGALVNTAALDSVVNTLGSEIPIVGYGVAYPFGVFGPIFCIYLVLKFLRPKIPVPPRRGVQVFQFLSSLPDPQPALASKRQHEDFFRRESTVLSRVPAS
jgi:putative transport protein